MKQKGIFMKYLLLSLVLSTQLFSYEKNKTITIYGYVSEKENHYIINAYHIDGKGVKDTPLQLLFDSNNTSFIIPTKKYSKHSKLKGIILDGKKIFKVSSIEKLHGKMKVASYLNKYGKVKLMAKSRMVGKEESERKKIEIDYIRNLKVKADNKLIYNVNLSPCNAENPLLKFSYKDIKPRSLTLEYTDNNGVIKENTIKVEQSKSNKIRQISQHFKPSKNVQSYPNQIESIKKLFGDITLIEDGIKLTAPKLAENGGSIPISIRSSLKFKSIALFMKVGNSRGYSFAYCGELDKYTLVSQIFSTPYSLLDFNLKIKMRDTGEIIVVLEAENGKFYTIKQKIDVSIGGVDAGG